MVSKVSTASLFGLEVQEVTVEVDYRQGLSNFQIVGLADRSVQESKERIIAAIRNSGCEYTPKRLTVNLAPAPFHKSGSSFDLAIAISYLLCTSQIKADTAGMIFLGELGLGGELRRVPGVFPILIEVAKLGYATAFVPADSYEESRFVSGIKVIPVSSLKQLVQHFQGKQISAPPYSPLSSSAMNPTSVFDLIQGQHRAKRAAEIIAAGGHNMLLFGPPGSGKSMLASSLPELFPPMLRSEIEEVSKIYSVCGLLPKHDPFISARPFRSPHHTITRIAMLGGGHTPLPGEISLAHKGILFLDEFAEFEQGIRESLREPLENREISISRASYKLVFPAEFSLVIASNPCRCGHFGDEEIACSCTPSQVAKYRSRLSGPILDRLDIKLTMNRISTETLLSDRIVGKSKTIRQQVINAREIQRNRSPFLNASMPQIHLKESLKLGEREKKFLRKAVEALHLSPRGYYRMLRVARTIADLEQSESVIENHLAEAVSYRL